MENKRGQFYIIAAIIIIIIIFSVVTVKNYAKTKPKETVIYDLKKELNLETGKVWDWTIYNKVNTDQWIGNWTESYINARRDVDVDNWIFLYGNSENLTILTFKKESTGTISIISEGSSSGVTTTTITGERGRESLTGNEVQVVLNEISYNFTLQPGQNFIFLIEKGEYVV